jgi:hypothetical protein
LPSIRTIRYRIKDLTAASHSAHKGSTKQSLRDTSPHRESGQDTADVDVKARLDGAVNQVSPFCFDAGKEMERDNSIQHPPDGVPVQAQIERRRKLAPFDTIFENLLDDIDGFVGGFDDVAIDILRQIHVGGMKHEGHQNSEQFPIIQKEIHVDVRKMDERLGRAGGGLKNIGDAAVEFVDIAQKDLCVNFFFAIVIKVNRPFAQLCFPGDALDGDRLETLLKKKPPGRLQDGALAILTFPFSSFFKSQDPNPSEQSNRPAPHDRACNYYRISVKIRINPSARR